MNQNAFFDIFILASPLTFHVRGEALTATFATGADRVCGRKVKIRDDHAWTNPIKTDAARL